MDREMEPMATPQAGGKVGTRTAARGPPDPASLTSLTDSHTPASCSSRTRLATDTTPWASSSQGPVKGSGSQATRAVTLFRKCTTASSTAGPSGAASSARTLSRTPRKLEALARDRSPWGSDRGSGRSCGQRSCLLLVRLSGEDPPGATLGLYQGLFGGWESNLLQAPSSQGLQSREHKQP